MVAATTRPTPHYHGAADEEDPGQRRVVRTRTTGSGRTDHELPGVTLVTPMDQPPHLVVDLVKGHHSLSGWRAP